MIFTSPVLAPHLWQTNSLTIPKKGWIGSTRGRPSSTSPPPTVNSGSRWLFILFTLVFYPFVLRWFFIFFILVFYHFVPGWSKLATDSPQCDLDSEIEVNEQTNKNMETMLSTNISSNQFTRADRQTLNQHTMKSWNHQAIHSKDLNFDMIGTGIRTLGTGVQILVYCQSVSIDSGSY